MQKKGTSVSNHQEIEPSLLTTVKGVSKKMDFALKLDRERDGKN